MTIINSQPEPYSLLQLSSANGPVYRRVKRQPLRNARPEEIPLIDISDIFSTSASARSAVAAKVHHASSTIGFFYITGHGIPLEITAAASKSARDFFVQPEEVKDLVNADRVHGFNGWKPPKSQRINETESVDLRETFSLTYMPSLDPSVEDVKTIPDEIRSFLPTKEQELSFDETSSLPNFKQDIIAYWQACLKLTRALTRTFALSLSLPETYFDSKISHPDVALAMNFYPSIPVTTSTVASTEENVSIGSHTDFQLLWQDSVGGLQVLNPAGEWIKAVPIPGSLVVNIGDCLMRITNDQYQSTVHRVQNTSGRERLSMAYFFGFNLNEMCTVLESCVDEKNPAKYAEISCADWIKRRAEGMYVKEQNK